MQRLARALAEDPNDDVAWASVLVRSRLGDQTSYSELVEGIRRGFDTAADALPVLLEITGGKPNHGFDYGEWKKWLRAEVRPRPATDH